MSNYTFLQLLAGPMIAFYRYENSNFRTIYFFIYFWVQIPLLGLPYRSVAEDVLSIWGTTNKWKPFNGDGPGDTNANGWYWFPHATNFIVFCIAPIFLLYVCCAFHLIWEMIMELWDTSKVDLELKILFLTGLRQCKMFSHLCYCLPYLSHEYRLKLCLQMFFIFVLYPPKNSSFCKW